jgi:CHASE3 domain sensor protein
MPKRRSGQLDLDTQSLVRWIFVTAFLAIAGIAYVYLCVQVIRSYDQVREKKAELAQLQEANDAMSTARTMIWNLINRASKENNRP